ncbi:Protein SMG9 [Camellia lanceoleosa]|uniref:Protein SMG9 n=1 Tax=Camellia lanceoleosa TaxID=1840588 RepID=A0ACC0IUN7_9ERIC|nr:Protein SMG9 [Camellia lanceoleosa]
MLPVTSKVGPRRRILFLGSRSFELEEAVVDAIGRRSLSIVERGQGLRRAVLLVGFEVCWLVAKLQKASLDPGALQFMGCLSGGSRNAEVWVRGEEEGGSSIQIVVTEGKRMTQLFFPMSAFGNGRKAKTLLRRRWTLDGRDLLLEWWTPLALYASGTESPPGPREWICVTGLPLHLRGEEVYCADESSADLGSLRLCVRGLEKMPMTVLLRWGSWSYSLPTWVEVWPLVEPVAPPVGEGGVNSCHYSRPKRSGVSLGQQRWAPVHHHPEVGLAGGKVIFNAPGCGLGLVVKDPALPNPGQSNPDLSRVCASLRDGLELHRTHTAMEASLESGRPRCGKGCETEGTDDEGCWSTRVDRLALVVQPEVVDAEVNVGDVAVEEGIHSPVVDFHEDVILSSEEVSRLQDQDLSPHNCMQLKKALMQYFRSSSFKLTKYQNAAKDHHFSSVSLNNHSNNPDSTLPNLFLIPFKSKDDSPRAQYESFISTLWKLRDQVLSMSSPSFARTVSERDWLKNSAKIWELVKNSSIIAEYSRTLHSSGMFRR